MNLSANCIMRGLRALVNEQSPVLVCFKVASNRAVVSIELNCEWLNMLYPSTR